MAFQSGMSRLSWLWCIPLGWVVFWTLQRSFVVFFMSAEFAKQDFAATVIPPGINPVVVSGFFKMIDRFMDKADLKYYTLRVHVATSFVMMFICMAQIMPVVRRQYMSIHRKLGYLYATLLIIFALEMAFTTYIVGVALPSKAVPVSDTLGLISMIGGTVGGVYFARKHNIQAHRACMLINIGGLFHIPVQRIWWLLLSQNKYKAPYSSFEDWVQKPLETGIWLAWGTIYATCVACILVPGKPTAGAAKKVV